MIRFLHAADLHLGLRITRFEEGACQRIGEARFAALEQLRAKAAEHQVHFVLIAGDVFDDHSVSRSIAERAFTLFEGKTVPCPVYIIPGNHDPLTPGGVWDRDPWTREQPTKHIRLLREPTPVSVPGLPVTIFPCPLRNRNSIDDPTAWITQHRETNDGTIRIGLAHGSLNLLPNLPLDDHVIRRDAADHYRLDYLALGHWHKPLRCRSADGAERIAYSGTHEPMRFPGHGGSAHSTGWTSYSTDGDAERFQDEGRGTAHLVTIEETGAPPQIETVEVGRLRWSAERRDMTSQSLGEIIKEYANRVDPERMILRLNLFGVMDLEKHQRIGADLHDIVHGRYCPGSSFHADEVLVEPTPEQLSKIVGDGVLSRMLQRLQHDSGSTDAETKRVADHALKLLYRIAWEELSK